MHFAVALDPSSSFLPHSVCYLWNRRLIWLHVISDSVVAAAYFSIPITLLHFVRRRPGLPFHWIFGCFALFIVACGGTHIMEVVTLWLPLYWYSGILKAATALISLATALALIRIVPQALALPLPEEMRKVNVALEAEIAQHKQAEEAVSQLNRNLQRRGSELSQINDELESFSYSVSHDLRAPLRRIAGFSRILQEDFASSLPPEAVRHLERIEVGTRGMGMLVDDLLKLSRLGRQGLDMQPTPLASLVKEAVTLLEPETHGRQIEWKIADLPSLECDPALIQQVFQNLIGNALKYSRPRSPAIVEIGEFQQNGRSVVFVRDNGVGFSMKYADKLFGVFQRLHHSDDFEGTGVGLATVHRIVQKHGGRVWAESEPDKGATFYFTLGGAEHSAPETAAAAAGGEP